MVIRQLTVILYTYAAREDWLNTYLIDPDSILLYDSSSFVENGTRVSGYAVVTLHQSRESSSLVPVTSSQLAELIALTKALQCSEGQKVNIYTDDHYTWLAPDIGQLSGKIPLFVEQKDHSYSYWPNSINYLGWTPLPSHAQTVYVHHNFPG